MRRAAEKGVRERHQHALMHCAVFIEMALVGEEAENARAVLLAFEHRSHMGLERIVQRRRPPALRRCDGHGRGEGRSHVSSGPLMA